MKFTKMIAGAIATVAVAAVSVGSVFAQTTQFADFTQQTNSKLFVFTNNGSSSTFTATAPVFFSYRVPNGTGTINTQIAGTLVLSATVDSPATASGPGGRNIDQTFGTTTLTFTSSTPILGHTNLLTVTAVDSDFSGKTTNGAPTLQLDGVTFTSDFLDFTPTVDRNGALSFSSFNNLSIDGNGYLTSNQGTGTGTFASNPPPAPAVPTVPEPATTAAMGLGVLGIFGMMFRARKRSTLSVTA